MWFWYYHWHPYCSCTHGTTIESHFGICIYVLLSRVPKCEIDWRPRLVNRWNETSHFPQQWLCSSLIHVYQQVSLKGTMYKTTGVSRQSFERWSIMHHNFFSVDVFYEPDDFGMLDVVTIGHDFSGRYAGWDFEQVSFTPWLHVRGTCRYASLWLIHWLFRLHFYLCDNQCLRGIVLI